MAVVPERPVGVSREPVVVVAVEHDRRVGRDAAASEHPLERLLGRDVAHGLVLQVLAPVPGDGALDVSTLVGRRVDVDLDQAHALVAAVLGGPLGADERFGVGETV